MPLPTATTCARGSGQKRLVRVTNLVRHHVCEHPPNLPIMVQAVHCIKRPLPGHGSVVNLSAEDRKIFVTMQCKRVYETRDERRNADSNTVVAEEVGGKREELLFQFPWPHTIAYLPRIKNAANSKKKKISYVQSGTVQWPTVTGKNNQRARACTSDITVEKYKTNANVSSMKRTGA